MKASEWKALAGLGALALLLSVWSEQAAMYFLGTVALVGLLTHGAAVRDFFGLAKPKG